jgi:hypothetical protein
VQINDALVPEAVPVEDLIVHRKLLEKLPFELVEKYLLVLFFPVGNLSQRRVILGYGREVPPQLPEKVKSVLGVQIYTLPLNPEVALSFLHETGRAHAKGPERGLSAGPPAGSPPHGDVSPRSAAPQNATERRGAAAKEPSPGEPRKKAAAGGKGESTSLLRQAGGDTGLVESGASPPAPVAHASPAQASGHAVSADLVLQALLSLLAKKGLATREELEVEIELARIRQRAVHLPAAPPPQGR